MLGRDHALLGAFAYLAGAPVVTHAAHLSPQSPIELAVGSAVCAGFALLPDIDEPGSTISRKLGPISRGFSKVTNELAGGHRMATHSLLFVAGTWFAAHYALRSHWAVGILVLCALALSLRMILPLGTGRAGLLPLALTGGPTYWVVHSQDVGGWLPWACAAGVLLHLIGDALTVEGVPFFWVPLVHPLQRIRLALPLLGHTSSVRESIVGSLLGLAIIWFAIVNVVVPEGKLAPTQAHHLNVPAVHLPSVHVPPVHVPGGGAVSAVVNKVKGLG